VGAVDRPAGARRCRWNNDLAVICGASLEKPGHGGRVFAAEIWRFDLPAFRANIFDMTVHTPPSFSAARPPDQVSFDRTELGLILGVYGRMVAAGEWRDYALSFLREMAVFSVFRRAAEFPIYRIEKHPRLRNRQGMYAVLGMDGQVLKRGHDLTAVLRVLERKLIRPID
jgi:hypothetical protein